MKFKFTLPKVKINIIVFLNFFICSYGFSQDTTTTKRILYKIPGTKSGSSESLTKSKLIAEENKSVISCAVNSITKEAIVSTKLANGNVSKEVFIIKEINK